MNEKFDILDENGNFINLQAERDDVHSKGLWHRAVVIFLVNNKNQVLLQRRSLQKKKWPNMLDVSAGGHSSAGEFGYETAIRETYEELGVKVNRKDLIFIGCTKNSFVKNDIKDNMFNEYYIAMVDLDVTSLKLQTEEVCEAKFVSLSELKNLMDDGYKELTPKIEAYEFLFRFLEKNKTI